MDVFLDAECVFNALVERDIIVFRQEIRAKALELAILIKGQTKTLAIPQNVYFVIKEYEPLANAIKNYIDTGIISQTP
jgi:hypothetical protein